MKSSQIRCENDDTLKTGNLEYWEDHEHWVLRSPKYASSWDHKVIWWETDTTETANQHLRMVKFWCGIKGVVTEWFLVQALPYWSVTPSPLTALNLMQSFFRRLSYSLMTSNCIWIIPLEFCTWYTFWNRGKCQQRQVILNLNFKRKVCACLKRFFLLLHNLNLAKYKLIHLHKVCGSGWAVELIIRYTIAQDFVLNIKSVRLQRNN